MAGAAPAAVRIGELGGGDVAVDLLVVPGVFESAQLARALKARLEADAVTGAGGGAAQRVLARARIALRSVVPPGYERDPTLRALPEADEWPRTLPDNDEYRRRLRRAESERAAGAIRVNFHHSWGAAVAAPLWGESGREQPDLAILSAPAWADCVTIGARIGGALLALPGMHLPARLLIPIGMGRLLRTRVVEAERLVRAMPDGFSSRVVAHLSYARVRDGVPLCRGGREEAASALPGAGKRVVLAQGTADRAVDGKKALARYRELLRARADWRERVELIEGNYSHFPFLETPGMLAEVLERVLIAGRGAAMSQ